MKRSEAVQAVITLNGGVRFGADTGVALPRYRFPSLAAADHCKAILDALLPSGSTGGVFLDGRLLIDLTFIDSQAEEQLAALTAKYERYVAMLVPLTGKEDHA